MKKSILTALSFAVFTLGFGQSILNDNFSNYNIASFNGQGGWSTSSPPGTGACFSIGCNIAIVSKNMSYTAFGSCTKALNPIGGITADGPGKTFSSAVTSGSVYLSMLVNITEPSSTTAMQIARLMDNSFTTATRLYIQKSAAGAFKLGVDKNGSAASYTSGTFSYGVDMLVVLKYTYNSGTTTDDQVTLYVNPNIANPEASSTPALTFTSASTDATTITRVAFPWNSSTIPTGFIGAVTASTIWGSTLPNAAVKNLQINKTSATKAVLSWEAEAGSQLSAFTIQQSLNGNFFTDVNTLQHNTTSYQQEISLNSGINFIRLVSTDIQGKQTYYQVFTLKSGSIIKQLSISPNPTKGLLFITLNSKEEEQITLQISDVQGKIISNTIKQVQKGENIISIDASGVKSGNYFVKLINSTTTESAMFQKQ